MLPYWCLFLVAAGMAVRKRHGVLGPYVGSRGGLWGLFFVVLGVIIGLRPEVGGDWYNYLRILELARLELLPEALTKKDPAYALINWFAANRWGDIYLVNSVCALFFSWGLYAFCRAQPRPWLAVVVAMPYLITVVAMGYARQGGSDRFGDVGAGGVGAGSGVALFALDDFGGQFPQNGGGIDAVGGFFHTSAPVPLVGAGGGGVDGVAVVLFPAPGLGEPLLRELRAGGV